MENIRIQKLKIPCSSFISDGSSINQLNCTPQLFKINKAFNQNNRSQKQFVPSFQFRSLSLAQKKKQKRSTRLTVFENNLSKLGLRKIMQQQKVNSLVNNFSNKIRRNLSFSSPIQFNPYSLSFGASFFNSDGFQIPNWFGLTFAFLSTLQIFALFFVYTLSLIFNSLIDSQFIQALQTFSMCFYTIEIIINFLSIKTIDGRKIHLLREIFANYIKSKFLIDLICLIILFVDINSQFLVTRYLRLFVMLKIKQCLEKIQKIENFFINNFYKEQYWSLAKVILVNFGFAHILAIFLLAMTNFSPDSNWITIKIGNQNAPWYELYAWAYYWGTTIMLTVGFGDLSATNYKQAICLTLLQTFSCILLAYNINCVGNLISNIRMQDLEKTRNFKIMRKLAEKNEITDDLQWKVCNFIDQSDKMKKQFGFQQEKQFISKLPKQFKGQFLKQSNIKIFQKINFFKNFTDRTLLTLAQHVQAKIAHPQQIIFKTQDIPQLLILKQGKVGYCTKLLGSDYCGTVIDIIKIQKDQYPKLLYLGFLSENIRNIKYKIKSLKYSMIYFLGMQEVTSFIKNYNYDFQNLCQMKDKSKHILDQFQILDCQYCSGKHSKMSCSKLHYCPIYQIVIYRQLQSIRKSKNIRIGFERTRNLSQIAGDSPLKLLGYFKKIQQQIYKNKKANGRLSKNKLKKSEKVSIGFTNNKTSSCGFNKIKSGKISSGGNQFRKIEQKLFESIVRIFQDKKNQQAKQFFWDLQCDIAHNYKFYFPQFNPQQLCHFVFASDDVNNINQVTSLIFNFLTK